MIKIIKIKKIIPLRSDELEDKTGLFQMVELYDKPVQLHFNHLYNIKCEDLVEGINFQVDGEKGIIVPIGNLGDRLFKFTFSQRREQGYIVELEVDALPLKLSMQESQLKDKEIFTEYLRINEVELKSLAEKKREEESEKEELLGEY